MASETSNEKQGAPPSNPLAEILEMISSDQSAGDKKSDVSGANQTAQTSSPISSDLFSALLSNPELIAKLPSILSAIRPIVDSLSKSGTPAANAEAVQTASLPSIAHTAPSGTAPAPPHKQDSDRRAALLCAMKPYLCHERQEAIDYIIKLSRLGDILKSL